MRPSGSIFIFLRKEILTCSTRICTMVYGFVFKLIMNTPMININKLIISTLYLIPDRKIVSQLRLLIQGNKKNVLVYK